MRVLSYHYLSQRTNSHFRQEENGHGVGATDLSKERHRGGLFERLSYRSDVRQRKRSTGQILGGQLARFAQLLQSAEFTGNLTDRELLDVLYVGDQQTVFGIHGDADVVRTLTTAAHRRTLDGRSHSLCK